MKVKLTWVVEVNTVFNPTVMEFSMVMEVEGRDGAPEMALAMFEPRLRADETLLSADWSTVE